jgi:hypothetical protein
LGTAFARQALADQVSAGHGAKLGNAVLERHEFCLRTR